MFERPRTPMDNNLAERVLRGPVIGRRLSFGSDSEDGARLAALMYSVVGTLNLNRIDVPRWLDAWLAACAANGGRPPDDLAPWLPWSMDDARRRELTAPGPARSSAATTAATSPTRWRCLIAGPPALNRHALSREFAAASTSPEGQGAW